MRPPTVIYYHQIVSRPRKNHMFFANQVTADHFRADMLHLKSHYTPLSMQQMSEIWQRGQQWPSKSVVVTFDDGFKNNLLAARVLNDLGMSATFFVLSDVLDGKFIPSYLRFAHVASTRKGDVFDTPLGHVDFSNVLSLRKWMLTTKEHILRLPNAKRFELLDELAALLGAPPIDPADEDYHYMRPDDLREMVRLGMTIGGHGASHEKLSRCSDQELQREMVDSSAELSDIIGRPIDFFSYPDGRFDQRVLDLAARHYKLAFAADENLPAANRYAYPRRVAGTNMAKVLQPWYGIKRKGIRVIKRLLGEPRQRWDT